MFLYVYMYVRTYLCMHVCHSKPTTFVQVPFGGKTKLVFALPGNWIFFIYVCYISHGRQPCIMCCYFSTLYGTMFAEDVWLEMPPPQQNRCEGDNRLIRNS